MRIVTRRSFLQATAAAAAAAMANPRASAEEIPEDMADDEVRTQNHDDPHLYLFVDDHEIERMEGLLRVVNRPKKHAEPVLIADRPWEGERAQAWGSVILEPDGRLRIWYFAFNTQRRMDELDRGGYAYAESRNGTQWEKPALGIVEFKGSRQNNLFYTCAPDGKNLVDEELARQGVGLPALDLQDRQIGVVNNLDGLTVVRDDDEPDPDKRYKLIANMQDHRMWAPYYRDRYPDVTEAQVQQAQSVFGQYIDTSPDGIHWTRRPRRVLSAVGDYMMVTRDHRNRRWWLNERASGGHGGRNAALRTSDDLIHWTDPQLVFDNGPDSEHGRLFEWHGGITPFNYGRVNLGFLEKWPNIGFGGICELVVHRDGGAWQRVAPGTAFLDIGPEGAFDRALIYPTHNAPVRIGDEIYIFYTGGGTKTDPNQGIPMSIGLATVRLDRFAGLACWRRSQGLVITKPLKVDGDRLHVNVEFLEHQPVRVAVAGEDGSILPGYSFDECRTDVDVQRIYTPVRWHDKPDLSELRGRSVSLHFQVSGGVLYGFRWDKKADL